MLGQPSHGFCTVLKFTNDARTASADNDIGDVVSNTSGSGGGDCGGGGIGDGSR
jgi:hypothetical protein